MFLTWLAVLGFYSLFQGGPSHVPAIAWLLLIPFFLQDQYDGPGGWMHRRR